MIGTEIIQLFAQLINEEGDNPLDTDFTLQLLNLAKVKLEELTEWEYLKKKWSITTIVLPTDFNEPIGIYSYMTPVPLRSYDESQFFSDGYYIDYSSKTINAIGSYSQTPVLIYKKNTDEITVDTSPEFPVKFHPILAYEMAFIYQSGIDGDDLNFKMSPVHLNQYNILKSLMLTWDSKLKLKNMNGVTEYDLRYAGGNEKINLI
jgi:hypothetical protein